MHVGLLLGALSVAGSVLATPLAPSSTLPLPSRRYNSVHHGGCDHAEVRRRLEARAARHAAAAAVAVNTTTFDKRQAGSFNEGGGSVAPSGGGASASGYQCDPSKCTLPDCRCASTTPPGNLDMKDVPMFITLTSDDAVQSYTMAAVDSFIGQRKNPNGCPVASTYFVSLNYTNYTLLTENHVTGHQELADHTMYHVGDAPAEEISGNLIAQNALGGIPFKDIIGFRAPYLNYSANTLKHLHDMGFTYDSSSSSSVPVSNKNTDAYWPYTLDNGMANDCDTVQGICQGALSLPGQWEIPMYAIFGLKDGQLDPAQPHLMDPYLDTTDANTYLEWLKANFLAHYHAQKQPFGLYFHPIHLATTYPGASADTTMIDATNQFLDWATTSSEMQDVWMVTNRQLLAWMKNPVPASQLNTLPEFQCQVPNVSQHICNGLGKYGDLTDNCFNKDQNMYFLTCYGCPEESPSPQQPNPPQKNKDGKLRTRISDSCDTAWWDPIAGKCLCDGGSDCAFTDSTRPIGPNGANLTSNASTNARSSASGSAAQTNDPYTPWGGKGAAPHLEARAFLPVVVLVVALVSGVYVLV